MQWENKHVSNKRASLNHCQILQFAYCKSKRESNKHSPSATRASSSKKTSSAWTHTAYIYCVIWCFFSYVHFYVSEPIFFNTNFSDFVGLYENHIKTTILHFFILLLLLFYKCYLHVDFIVVPQTLTCNVKLKKKIIIKLFNYNIMFY